jgi:hypothetical protein
LLVLLGGAFLAQRLIKPSSVSTDWEDMDSTLDWDEQQKVRDAGLFEVRDIPGKGKGVVALRDIKVHP